MNKRLLLYIILFATTSFSLQAANRYWVGGTGTWEDAAHWSLTSGGTGGAPIPVINDNVIFNQQSFTADKQTVMFTTDGVCNSIDWSGINYHAVFSAAANKTLTVYGSYKLSPLLSNGFKGTTIFASSQSNNTITTFGRIIIGNWQFNGTGSWLLSDDLITNNQVTVSLIKGNLNTNNKNITVGSFVGNSSQIRSLNLTSSQINIINTWDFTSSANLAFTAGSSNIILQSGTDSTHFRRGHITYNLFSTVTNTCGCGNGIQINLSGTNIICNGACNGTATVTSVTGGTGNYTYLWSPGITVGQGQGTTTISQLCAGTYTVKVTDIGNAAHPFCFCAIQLTEPAVLFDYEVSTTPPTCNGLCNAVSSVDATGGTFPYTFTWSPGSITGDTAKNICAGTYTVVVTDSRNCTASTTITVSQPAPLLTNGGSTNLTCNGTCNGTATVSPSGGTPNYSYSWAPGNPTGNGTANVTNLCAGTLTCTVTDANNCTASFITTITQPTSLTGAITSQTNVVCRGASTGSVTVAASNGTPTYTYSINGVTFQASGTFSALAAGNYTITIKDSNGCTATVSVTITQPATAVAGIISSQTNVLCRGGNTGSVTVTGTNGTPGYTYSINGVTFVASGTFSNLIAGNYTISVKDSKGCITTVSVTITQPAAVVTGSISAQTNVLCNGGNTGSVTVAGNGGTPGYTYAIDGVTFQASGTFNGLIAGSYTITVKDANGCTATVPVTITQPTVLTGSITSQTNVLCHNGNTGSATAAGNNGTPGYTYAIDGVTFQASGTFNGLTAGIYTITIKDTNGCTITVSVTITQPSAVTGAITAQTNILCRGANTGSVTVAGNNGTPGYTYSIDGITFQASGTFSNLTAGNYTITVKDSKGCTVTVSVTITQPATAVAGTISSQTNVLCKGGNTGSVTITGLNGTPGYTYSIDGITFVASGTFSNLIAGNYTITIKDSNGCTATVGVTITEPATPVSGSISSQTNVLCFGTSTGCVTVAGNGGTPGYTYSIDGITFQASGTFCNLAAGSYTIIVKDANGCTVTVPVTITQPPVFSGSITSQTNVLCHGGNTGSVTIAGNGGTPGYTYSSDGTIYQASGTFNGLTAGSHTFFIKDSNGCIVSVTVTITQPTALTGSITSQTNVLCHGGNTGSVTVAGSNGTPGYTYSDGGIFQGSGTFNGLTAGSYTLTIKDSKGCTINIPVTITEPNALTVSISATVLSCHGDCNSTAAATVTGGSPAYTFAWSPGVLTGNGTSIISSLCAGTYNLNITDSHGCLASSSVTISEPPILTLTSTSTNITCFGLCNGSATTTSGGGTPGYSYLWLPGGQTTPSLNSLCVGSYSVTITDAHNCSLTNTVTITQPQQLIAHPSVVNNISCHGACDGSATAAPTGGTRPYTFNWTPGNPTGDGTNTVTNLCAGTYNIIVTDSNLCTSTQPVTITQPAVLIAPITGFTNSCNICNGTATVTPSGGIGPYTFLWAPTGQSASTATGLCPNITYTVTVKDSHNCTATDTITIFQTVTISISTTNTTLSCFGSCNGTASANASGGTPPYSFLWTGPSGPYFTQAVSGLCAGTFTVKVTDAVGCFNTATVTFTNPPQLNVGTTVTNITCNGLCNGVATATPNGGTGGYTYSWNTIPVQTTSGISSLCVGTYLVTVTDGNGCTNTTQATITQPVPVVDHATITVPTCIGNNGSISVTPSGGAGGYSYVWGPGNPTGQGTSTITNLALGAYTLTITDAFGCVFNFNYLLSSPAGPTLVMSHTNISCHNLCDGTASVVASGGGGGYVYNWTPGNPVGNGTPNISNLCSGTYTVQVTDAGGCVSLNTVVLPNHTLISPNPTIVNTSCFGSCNGSISLAPTGGTGVYTYSWLPGGQTTSTITNLCAGNYTVHVRDGNSCDSTLTIAVNSPLQLTVTLASTNDACNGVCNGTASTTVVGGTPSYSYAWSNGPSVGPNIIGLCPNQYIVTVTDAHSCVAKDTVVITQPPVLTTTTSHLNISCNNLCNGTAIVSPNGGTAPYTYLWNPGNISTATASNLCAGTYTATVVDANGCSSSPAPVNITQPVAIVPNATFTLPTCNGLCNGTAASNPTGGTPPYTYTWMPGNIHAQTINNLCAGSYTVTVTDLLNCTATQTINIVNPPILNANVSSTPPTCTGICNGSVSSAPLGGTAGYTYSWSPIVSSSQTVSNLCPGVYSVTVTDSHNCTSTQSITVNPASAIDAIIGSTPASCGACNGTINLTPITGTGPYTYLWSPSVTGQGTSNGSNICAGIYNVTITDFHGCDSTFTIAMNNSSGPTGETVVTTDATCNNICNGSGTVTPIGGLAPYTFIWNNPPANTANATASNLCAGNYLVQVTDANSCVHFSPVTINQPTPIVANAVVTNATCGGICNGSITVAPTGGTAGYTYSWAPGNPTGQGTPTITSLCQGSYTLTITDSHLCIQVDTFIIGQSAPIIATINHNTISCSNACTGIAYVTITSGTAPFSTQWNDALGQTNDTATALCAGNYSVLITDALGCNSTMNTNITATPPVIANATVTDATCGVCNGHITATPTGGTGTYTYLWSNAQTTSSISNLCTGLYSVSITDAVGCNASVSVPVSNSTGPSSANITSTNVTCFGLCNGSVSNIVPVGGNAPYTFLWISGGQTTPALSNLCAGTYFVQITDANGCSLIDSVVITQPAQMNANPSFTAPTCGACDGSVSINPNGCAGAITVLWNTGSSALSLNNLCAGVYSVQLTCSNGCTQNVAIPLSSQSGPTLSMTTTPVTCNGACDGTATVTASNGVPPYSYVWSNTPPSGSPTATALCAGSYVVQVTGNNGCVTIAGATINQPSPLGLSLANVINPTCSGSGNGSITAIPSGGSAPYTYSWAPYGGTGVTAVGLSLGSFTLTLTDSHGCMATQTTNVSSPTPITISSVVTPPSCNTIADGSISITAGGGTQGYTYQWSGGSSATTPTINSLMAGTYSVTVTDTHLCTLSDTIIVNPALTVIAFAGNDTTFCNLGAITLSATGSVGGVNYQWFQMPANTPVGNTMFISVTPPTGTISYYVIVDNGTGCSDKDTVAVTSTPLPTAHAGNDVFFCNPTPTLLNASTSINAVSYQWFQMPANTSISNKDTVTVNPPAGTTSYYVSVGNSSGCFSNDTVNVVVNPPVIAHAGNDTAICRGATITLNAGGSINGVNYQWFQMPANTSVGNTASISVTPVAAVTSYYVVVDNGTICTSNDTVVISSLALPTAHAGNDSILCAPGAVTLNASTSINAISYQWYQLPANTNMGNTDTVTVNPPVGSTTQYYVVVSNGICTSNDTVSYTVYAAIAAHAGNDTTICFGTTVTLNASASVNGVGYNWYQMPANVNVGTAVSVSVTPTTGTTSYYVTVDNGNVCSRNDTVNVTTIALPIARAGNDTIICQSPVFTLNANLSQNGATYQWYQMPNTNVGSGITLPVSPPIGATTTYYVVVDNGAGCTANDTINITMEPTITAHAGRDTTFCQPGSILLDGSASTGNITSYQWFQLPSTSIANTVSTSITPAAGTSGYYIQVTNAGGCSSYDTVNVTANPLPFVNAGSNVVIAQGESTTLGGNPTGPPGAIYFWTPFTGLNDSVLANPVATPTTTTIYTVLVTSTQGCAASGQVTVTVAPNIIYGDGISPNGDGVNDVWQIDNIEKYPDCVVEIYNRWGELLFQSVGYINKWDGTFKGKPLPVGTYYYIINLNDPLYPGALTGPITILR